MFDGVTGIVRKPIEGAKNEGVEGFFKGEYIHRESVTEYIHRGSVTSFHCILHL